MILTMNRMLAIGILLLISAGITQANPAIGELGGNGRTSIEIRLTEDYQLLDEVIVVGYGAQKKINLTGSVATVSAEQITNRATPNLTASLSGLAPGVREMQGRGTPGDENVSIRIHGAANGVVLVTTKKGRREKPRVTISSLIARDQAVTSLKFISEMPVWMPLHNTAQMNNMLTSSWYSEEVIKAWEAANANPNGIYTDPVTGNQIPNRIKEPGSTSITYLFQAYPGINPKYKGLYGAAEDPNPGWLY